MKRKVLHTKITTEKIVRNVWVAKTTLVGDVNMEITMKGNSEENAVDKMKKFLGPDSSLMPEQN